MPETVTSGLGRNGPWLQNRWLRVESRLDDGSIAPVALGTAFRPSERVLASVDLGGGSALRFERSDYDVRPHEDALGKGRLLTLRSMLPRLGAVLRREVVLYDAHPFLATRVGLESQGNAAVQLDVMHAFQTAASTRGRLALDAPPSDWRIYRNGWQSWSPTMSFGGAERDVHSAPATLAPEEPQTEAGRFASDDVAVLFDPVAGRSMLVGAVTAHDFLSQVFVDAPAKALDARCLGDGLPLVPGSEAWSEWFLVDLTGHPTEQLERYGDALGRMMGARAPSTAPSGWCSWYYFYTQVTEDDVIRNLRFLERHRQQLPIQTVQIDDGYQADIGDWLTVNEKFPHGMKWLASQIKDAGYTPGIWVAPFLLAESSHAFAEHPDWVTRDDTAAPVVANNNWQRDNYGLDGTHPDAQSWLKGLFETICDGWGYDYVKIDFLFGAALLGRRHDTGATRVRAYRAALDAVRMGVGPSRFILGCGSLMAPSVGYFDGNRIGPDVAPFWRFLTRAERESPQPRPRTPDDGLSAETAIRNTLTRWWMHGRLWANDPDCLLVRTDRTRLTLDETRTLVTAIGLSGGMVLSSDDLDKLTADRIDLISMLLPPLPRSAIPIDLMQLDMPERFEFAVPSDDGEHHLIALFNFADEARDLTLTLPPGRWCVFERWEERYRGVSEGVIEFALVSPHACRLVALRPDTAEPRIVGTTAHIGCGTLDITIEMFDADHATLTCEVQPIGTHRRRIYFDPAGRQIAAAEYGGTAVSVLRSGVTCYVEVDAETATPLAIKFVT